MYEIYMFWMKVHGADTSVQCHRLSKFWREYKSLLPPKGLEPNRISNLSVSSIEHGDSAIKEKIREMWNDAKETYEYIFRFLFSRV